MIQKLETASYLFKKSPSQKTFSKRSYALHKKLYVTAKQNWDSILIAFGDHNFAGKRYFVQGFF